MAFITILCREVQLIIYAVKTNPIPILLGKCAIAAKLGVGLAQMWMMFELALRVKISILVDTNPRVDVKKFYKIIDYG